MKKVLPTAAISLAMALLVLAVLAGTAISF
jgi:hypothetical protein